jgi:hypothetical protein
LNLTRLKKQVGINLFYNLILKNRKKKRRKGARERNLIREKGTWEKKTKNQG